MAQHNRPEWGQGSVPSDLSWKDVPQEMWDDEDFNQATEWVRNSLAVGKNCDAAISDLLCTYGPEDITTEQIEAMMEIM